MKTNNPLDLFPTEDLVNELKERHELLLVVTYRDFQPGVSGADEYALEYDAEYFEDPVSAALEALNVATDQLEGEQSEELSRGWEPEDGDEEDEEEDI